MRIRRAFAPPCGAFRQTRTATRMADDLPAMFAMTPPLVAARSVHPSPRQRAKPASRWTLVVSPNLQSEAETAKDKACDKARDKVVRVFPAPASSERHST